MKKFALVFFVVASVGVLLRFAHAQIDLNDLNGISNVVVLEKDVFGGGILNEATIIKAQQIGVRSIIDLRSPDEGAGAERVLVKKYGLNYFNIPVTPYSLRKAQADVIHHILSDENNKPAIIHSNTGNRVGALWGLYSRFYRQMNQAESFKEALEKGLKTDDLKDKVYKLLED